MKIALAQLDMDFENKELAKKRCREIMSEAVKQQAELIVFPEMTLTGFTMSPSIYGESPENAPTLSFFQEEAKKNSLAVIFGIIFMKNGTAQNHCIVMDKEGNIQADYAKIHPFSYGAEAKHYVGGNTPAFCEIDGVPISPFICYDLRFPEIFQVVSKKSILITVIANWPIARIDHWKTLLQARAIENQCFIAGVNRTGTDHALTYSGNSMLISPTGEILLHLTEKDTLGVAEIVPADAETYRKEFPLKADRKEMLYSQLFQANK